MKTLKIITALAAGLVLLAAAGCNVLENETTSTSVLIIEAITGTDITGQVGSPIAFCDVLTGGSVFNDNGVATLAMQLINPGAAATYYQSIVVDQIDIRYTRSDGLSEEGKDVPYGFSQACYIKIDQGDLVELPFVLVQHNAKMESPLVELIEFGQEKVLKLEAHVTFHGHDLGGHRIQPQTGVISIYCADYGDAE